MSYRSPAAGRTLAAMTQAWTAPSATHIAAVRVALMAKYGDATRGFGFHYRRGVLAALDWLEAGEGETPCDGEWKVVDGWAGRERTRAMDREVALLGRAGDEASYYNGVAVTLGWYRTGERPPA